jgi:hypothetical protein
MPRRHVYDGMGPPAIVAFLADARIEMNKHPELPYAIMPADMIIQQFSLVKRGTGDQ